MVSAEGVATDPEKIKAVEAWPQLNNVNELQVFLVTVGYYRQYVKDFATIAKPLTILTSKGVP